MASKTTNYGLNKHSPQDFYNVEARNENWDKIDEALAAADPTKITTKAEPADGDGVVIADSADGGKAKRLLWSNVKAALGKLFVPLARKINGKTLAKDVTLTGDDIAMGADDAESLRTAMAKRDVEFGVIEPENLQEWASAQTAGGTFMLTPSTTKGVPYPMYWRGLLSGAFPGSDRALLIFTEDVMHRASTGSGKWDGPWRKVADCIAPEVHELPLNIAGSDNSSRYTIDQFGRVFVQIRSNLNTQWSGQKIIGTMPEGFRPKYYDAVVPLLIQNDPISYQIGQIVIQPGGNIYVHGSFTSAEYIFAQLTYPASV